MQPLSDPRHDGLIIMATNRPYDLGKAMHQRIMIAIKFCQPDYLLRKTIWETRIPDQMKLAKDANVVSTTGVLEGKGGRKRKTETETEADRETERDLSPLYIIL